MLSGGPYTVAVSASGFSGTQVTDVNTVVGETFRLPVDRTFPLGETPAAVRHLLDGRTRGKLVVAVR